MRKKYLLLFIFGLVLFLSNFLAETVNARVVIDESGDETVDNSVDYTNDTGDAVIPDYPSEVFTSGSGGVLKSADSLEVGTIFSKLLEYILPLAGIVLLFMLIMGGIGLMTAAGNPDKIKAGQGRITMALVGFLIIFVSYFIVQLVGVMTGTDLLGGGSGSSSTFNTSSCSASNCSNCNQTDCSNYSSSCKWAGGTCIPR